MNGEASAPTGDPQMNEHSSEKENIDLNKNLK